MQSFLRHFKGISQQSLMYITETKINAYQNITHLQSDSFEQFDLVHNNVLNAMQDNDLEYLKGIMENNLFQKTRQMIYELNRANYKLKLLEQEKIKDENNYENLEKDINLTYANSHNFIYSNKDIKIDIEAKGVFGVDINRQLNVNKKQNIIRYIEFKKMSTRRNYFFNYKNVSEMFKKQILVFDVYYYSSRKQQVLDSTDEIVYGSWHPNEWQLHKWRFETNVDQIDWILTDIDDIMYEEMEHNFYLNSLDVK